MWTRSNKKDGTFSITVWDNEGSVYLKQDGFTDYREAEKAAEVAQREVLFGNLPEMTDDEILQELGL